MVGKEELGVQVPKERLGKRQLWGGLIVVPILWVKENMEGMKGYAGAMGGEKVRLI